MDGRTIGAPGAVAGGRGVFEPERRRSTPRAYSADLRERVLAAYEENESRQAEVARRYRVGERTLTVDPIHLPRKGFFPSDQGQTEDIFRPHAVGTGHPPFKP